MSLVFACPFLFGFRLPLESARPLHANLSTPLGLQAPATREGQQKNWACFTDAVLPSTFADIQTSLYVVNVVLRWR